MIDSEFYITQVREITDNLSDKEMWQAKKEKRGGQGKTMLCILHIYVFGEAYDTFGRNFPFFGTEILEEVVEKCRLRFQSAAELRLGC